MAAASESRVLRFFGVEEAQVRQAASGLAGRCSLARIETRAQGAETLLALTAPPSALRKAEGLLGRTFPGGLYGAGGDTLARCAARALVQRDRLLACADTLALDLLAPRLEGQAGVDACFDFGAGSCADPATLARIEAGARRCQGPGPSEPVWDELCRLRAALRVTHADFVAGAIPLPEGTLTAVAGRRGSWLYRVPAGDNPALWLLDMIRRAAAGLPQAQGTRWVKYGADLPEELSDLPQRPAEAPEQGEKTPAPAASEETPAEGDKPSEPSKEAPNPEAWVPERNEPLPRPDPAPAAAEPPKKGSGRKWLGRLLVLLLLVVLAALGAAWYYTGGDLAALPEVLGIKEFSLSGASLMEISFIR